MNYQTIFITGAASGLGRALALALSGPGRHLYLADCNATGLEATRAGCHEKGATARTTCLDVTDQEAMTRWCTQDADRAIDLLLACAGVTGGVDALDKEQAAFESPEQIRRMMAVNLDGALNAILPVMERMRSQPLQKSGRLSRHRGQICAIASVAGLVSYPGTPSYSASKAALDRFLVASGAYSRRAGIHLSSVCCSFVATPMVAQNRFPMPGLMNVEDATAHILRGLVRRKRRIIFPSWLVLGSRFMDVLPIRLAEFYYTRQPTGRPGSMPGVDTPGCKDQPEQAPRT
ncbi:dehydrogenase [Asaia sp. W19]|uniref:SDR family NAD(P)-dependent oxidoreductase n=1 Tax=unclassified Asaia TaxID=2685023 RepID=UPI000F8C6E28|nr:SDR family NAD(P)-dependent oxidoreductase [Asaia sp. W19]RUT24716.1 dehydrogenase [Asaia sp. W19]